MNTITPPAPPALSKKTLGIFGVILAVATMLGRYVGVEVPECEQCPACPAASSEAP